MIDWLRRLGIESIELFLSLNGEGALVCPMTFVLAMEITKGGFLSSAAVIFSVLLVSLFAMVTIIAAGPFLVAVPLALPPVMVFGLSGFFFGHVVHCSLVLRLISVPRFGVGPLAAS